jgi:hypothetical protein
MNILALTFPVVVDRFEGTSMLIELVLMTATACKCINDFSALSNSNIKTGLETNVGDGHFELKLGLINMVQQSPFCGKALDDAIAHLHHFWRSIVHSPSEV